MKPFFDTKSLNFARGGFSFIKWIMNESSSVCVTQKNTQMRNDCEELKMRIEKSGLWRNQFKHLLFEREKEESGQCVTKGNFI